MALEEIHLRFSERLRKFSEMHPLVSRLEAPVLIRRRTRLPRTAALLPIVDKVNTTRGPHEGFLEGKGSKGARGTVRRSATRLPGGLFGWFTSL